MVTGSKRSYQEMVDALAEGLPQLQDTLSGLTAQDWQRLVFCGRPSPSSRPGRSCRNWPPTSTSSWG